MTERASSIKDLIESAIGPVPWYWQTFPVFQSEGRQCHWRYLGSKGPLANLVVLEEKKSGAPLLALNIYVRPFAANSGYLGAWYPTRDNGQIAVKIFNIASLRLIENFSQQAQELKKSRDYLLHVCTPCEQVRIPNRLPAGRQGGLVAHLANTLDEVFFLADGPPALHEDLTAPATSIYIWHPATGELEVLPQTWFTATKYDLGYQWITRVTRDPQTGRLVGGGIRIPDFELTAEGNQVLRWL